MTRATLVALCTGTVITSAAAIGLGTAGEPPAASITRTQHAATLTRIQNAREAALASCDSRRASERDACASRAIAAAKLQAAEVDVRFRRSPEAARAVQLARIEMRHQAAIARCAPLKGYDRDDCLIRVHARYGEALLQSQAPYAMRDD
jgi:hypothetical protein